MTPHIFSCQSIEYANISYSINWNDFRYFITCVRSFSSSFLCTDGSRERLFAKWKDFTIGPRGDTLNGVDKQDQKQGKWVNHFDEVRGEPGYEEEGIYKDNRKEGAWRIFSLQGDLIGLEVL